MNAIRPPDASLPSEIERLLCEPALAALHAGGAPVIVAAGDPARAVWANGAAQRLFRATTLDEISRQVFTAPGGDAGRLAQVAQSLRPDAPPRLERVRLLLGRRIETLTFVCRKAPGPNRLFVAVAMGTKPGQDGDAKMPAPLTAFAQNAGAPSAAAIARAPVMEPQAAFESPAAHACVASPKRRRSAAEVETALAAQFQNAAQVRFLWKSDAESRLVEITGQLGEIVGCDSAQMIGRNFLSLAAEAGVSPLDRLSAAFARRDTWSGAEVAWPVAGADAAVPVTLGALPSLDGSRAFKGFHGFGIAHIQRVEPRAGFDAPPEVVEPALPSAENPEAAPIEAAAARDEAPVVLETPPAMETARNAAPYAAADPGDEADALDREAEETIAVASAAPPPGAPTAQGANVVPLRAGYRVLSPPMSLPDAANDRREPGKPGAQSPAVELTAQERSAFREIARVLGAKAEADADNPDSAAEPAGAGASEETVAETRAAPEASATSEPRGLRIRDLIDVAGAPRDPAAPHSEQTPLAAAAEPADGMARNALAVLDRVPAGVLVSRMEMPVYLNRALLELLDFKDADAFHAAGGLERMFRGRQPQALSEAAGGGAIPLITRGGEVVSVIARMQAVDWDGAPASLMTFRQTLEADLAPRVRSLEAEARHRDGELRELHAILDTATDGVVVLDADGLILAVNRSAEALFGYDQNEVAGENFTVLLAKESHAAANDYLAGLKVNGVASVLNDGRDVTGRARQGGSMPMFMTLGRVSQAGGQKFCAVLRDMTAWKKAERELSDAKRDAERASALKSDFLAKVSHEIRTPLNAIIGFSEVIRDERFGPVGNARYKDYLKDIHSSGVHVMSLVNDLLDLSKIEAGKLDLNFGSVDANKIVAECVSLMQPQATRDRVIIRQSLAQRLPNIVADERSLRQIVLNLLSNAVKFNEPGGQVIVSTALTDAGHAVIRIKDTGIGMSEADVQTALEPFRQLQTSRHRGGTGLGLPLTKSLVEANRASFTIKSKKNEGTLVEVAFPPTRVLAE